MKKLTRISILGLLALAAFGQSNTLTQTSLSGAVTANATVVTVASATGISVGNVLSGTVGTQLYVVDIGQQKGEVMTVQSLVPNTTTSFKVVRTTGQTVAHASGAMVLAGAPNLFTKYTPTGSCTRSTTQVTPVVNTITGEQWLCSTITGTWTPGFQNSSVPAQTGTLVASVAGATAVNAPLQHVNGTEAITSFTMGIGWNGGGFCLYPDAAFTGTATNNIAKAFTAVADRTLCFTYDATNAKFAPSY